MAGRLAGKRILVVEDEYYIASDIRRALQKEEAVVIGPVGRLDAGLKLAAEERIDGAVLDVNLDSTFTYPLADRLAQSDVPSLFVTGYDGWSIPAAYRDAPRVAKPFSMPLVLDAVVEMLRAVPAA